MNIFNWFRNRRTLHCLIEPGGRGKYRWRVVDPSTLVARRAKKGEVVTPLPKTEGLAPVGGFYSPEEAEAAFKAFRDAKIIIIRE